MPDCEEVVDDGLPEEEQDVVSFAIEIHDPKGNGVKLSRKTLCIINIEPDNTEEELKSALEREKMIDYFISNKEVSWG